MAHDSDHLTSSAIALCHRRSAFASPGSSAEIHPLLITSSAMEQTSSSERDHKSVCSILVRRKDSRLRSRSRTSLGQPGSFHCHCNFSLISTIFPGAHQASRFCRRSPNSHSKSL